MKSPGRSAGGFGCPWSEFAYAAIFTLSTLKLVPSPPPTLPNCTLTCAGFFNEEQSKSMNSRVSL